MANVRAWAAYGAKQTLQPYEIDLGALGPEEVEVTVEHCGLCHSDLSIIDDEWGNASYPLIPGHEIVGRVKAMGAQAKGLTVGQRVGVGWTAASCMHCTQCLSGRQHLCAQAVPTILGHAGGFAEVVRAHWAWAIPIPEALDATAAGPLLCAGVTVFEPLAAFDVAPTSRVGIVGIGGLGHLAIQFAAAWGCEVVAMTSSPSKVEDARALGAHRIASSKDPASLRALRGALDLILVTANAPLDWSAVLGALAPRGRLHVVGVVPQPIPVLAFDLISGERSMSGSPTGSPTMIARMLDFAARHGVAPVIERFRMTRVNDAIDRLRAGRAHYRVVLDADFAAGVRATAA
jgi:uncharacterized zinc-type alcohol dehydrogenase-like protein